jgi:hypothetical protein
MVTGTSCLRHGPKFVIGALFGLCLFHPAVSQAWWQRYAAAACVNANGGGKFPEDLTPVPPGRYYRAQSLSESVICPVMSNNTAPHNLATAIWIQVVDNSTSRAIRAKACVKNFGATGGACGAWAATTALQTGQVPLPLSGSAWAAHPLHYPYIEVEMNASCLGAGGTGGGAGSGGGCTNDVGSINGYYVEGS